MSGDYRDIDIVSGFNPTGSDKKAWIKIGFDNFDLLTPTNSFNRLAGVNNPKATVSFVPSDESWLPTTSVSWGEAFFTQDPRIGTGTAAGSLVERVHSYQLVVDKAVRRTDFRLTLGQVTTDDQLDKIDPDTGLQQDEGPGECVFSLHYCAIASASDSCRHQFPKQMPGICSPVNPRQKPLAPLFMY